MNTPTSPQFCVRWNSHLGSLGAAFPELLASQYFVDVTLACEGHQLHCHRLVLASCSPYFSSLLRENPCTHPIMILPRDIKLWEMRALVDFMYKGEVNVSQIGLGDLLRSAETLQIRGLCGSDAIYNLSQVANSVDGGGNMTGQSIPSTINNNGPSGAPSSPLINNANVDMNEQNVSANKDSYSPASPTPLNKVSSPNHYHVNYALLANSNNATLNSQKSPIPSTPIPQNQKIIDFTSDRNNDSATSNRVVIPKEEPLDVSGNESMDDDSIKVKNDLTGQDYNFGADKNYGYLEHVNNQEILHHQNQTKQQQESNQFENEYSKIILQSLFEEITPNSAGTITVPDDIENNNYNNTRRLNNKRSSEVTRSNVLADDRKRLYLDNENDSEDSDVAIIEEDIPIIEISDEENEINDTENTGNNNDISNVKIIKNRNLVMKMNKEVKEIDKKVKRCVELQSKKRFSQQSQQQQQEYDIIPLAGPSSAFSPSGSLSLNTARPLTTRNKALPSSLKFDSQSMSISVKRLSTQDSLNNYSNLSTNNDQRTPTSFKKRTPRIRVNNDNNFENIVCAPNVINLSSNENISDFVPMNINNNINNYNNNMDENNDLAIYKSIYYPNYCDTRIDENSYNESNQNRNFTREELTRTPPQIINCSPYSPCDSTPERPTRTRSELSSLDSTLKRIPDDTSLKLSSSNVTTPGKMMPSTSRAAMTDYNSLNVSHSNLSPSSVVLRSPRSNQPRSYSNDALYAALMNVKDGESIYRASQRYKVPRKTLRNWMKRWDIKSVFPMPRQLKEAAEMKKLKRQQNK